jgi:hypothetical protein
LLASSANNDIKCTGIKSAVNGVVLRFFADTITGMETQRGRPAKTDKERRAIKFQVRLSPVELELLERAAGGKVSTWARNTLLSAAKRQAKA